MEERTKKLVITNSMVNANQLQPVEQRMHLNERENFILPIPTATGVSSDSQQRSQPEDRAVRLSSNDVQVEFRQLCIHSAFNSAQDTSVHNVAYQLKMKQVTIRDAISPAATTYNLFKEGTTPSHVLLLAKGKRSSWNWRIK